MKRFVYLAGPILDQSESEANGWRRKVATALEPHGIVGISPLRCEPIHGPTYKGVYQDERFGSARAIMRKNVFDVRTCDMILAYIPRPPKFHHHTWGTMAELSWAWAYDKPAVLVTDDPAIVNHPVISGSAGWVLNNFDDAVDVLVGILGGYTGGKNV